MHTEHRLAKLNEMASARKKRTESKRRDLVAAFSEMRASREADLAALKNDDALTASVRAMSSRTIHKMYLAKPNGKFLPSS